MIQRQHWAEHKFDLNIDPGWGNNIITRLESTEILLQHAIKKLTEDQFSTSFLGKWSIKKHVGHLIDLEILWSDRFDQFSKLVPELIAADMGNKQTKNTDYNKQHIDVLLNRFKALRNELIAKFRQLDPSVMYHKAFHRRLGIYMKPVDLLFFVAEHDDHHLTTIKEIRDKL